MNEQNSFERIVADSVASIGQLAPSQEAIERTVARPSRTRQRARWLALVAEPPMRRSSRLAVGSPTARVLAIMVATALLALMVAAGIAASRLLADDEMVTLGNGPIIVSGTAYDPSTGEMIGPDPCNCTTDAIWSADGQRVALRRSTRVYVVDLAEETERQLADCTGCDEPGDHISMAGRRQRGLHRRW